MTPEGKIKKITTELLKRYKAVYFMPVSNGMGRAGISDIIVCYKGRYAAIETKSAKGKPTALQLIFLKEITEAGGKAFIVRDEETLEAVEKWLRSII